MSPDKVGRYKIKSELGRGGMATVYRAFDPISNREVAIKVLHPQLLQHENLKERFRREARMHARIMHPHIVTLLSLYEDDQHMALVMGKVSPDRPMLVRMHSQCLTGDTLHSIRCDCHDQLKTAMKKVGEKGAGVIVYLSQEGRGIGLANKIRAYALQDRGLDTVQANLQLGLPADMRDYSVGAQILKDLGVRKIHLLTNNPEKVSGIRKHGLSILRRVPLEITPNGMNRAYLKVKKDKLGHLLSKVQ